VPLSVPWKLLLLVSVITIFPKEANCPTHVPTAGAVMFAPVAVVKFQTPEAVPAKLFAVVAAVADVESLKTSFPIRIS
jgi:hypothetical protein